MNEENLPNSVQLDLLSSVETERMTTMEKIRFVMDKVKDRNIVILEEGLTPDEESKLVEVTMSEIAPDGFSGVEIESYPPPEDPPKSFFSELSQKIGLTSQEETESLTLIGPADELETIHKDESLIQTLITRN